MIDKAFDSLEGWVTYLSGSELPVLRHTATELKNLRENANNANARSLAGVILRDPMMTMRVLRYIESHRRQRQHTDITTIERAIMMMGIEPFFAEFGELPVIEDHLAGHPQALLGLLKAINRARKAAKWAREWAILRHDLDVDEITVATLLRYAAEMLMWCFAPTLALQVRTAQSNDRQMRTSAAQRNAYGFSLNEVGTALATDWHLPSLITTLMDGNQAENPRVRNVTLACDLARHSANGWDDPALPDDYTAIGELLHINRETLLRKLGLGEDGKPIESA